MRTNPDIIVVDDFLADPDKVRTHALEQVYAASEYHKGQRSVDRFLSEALRLTFGHLLGRTVTHWEEHGANGRYQINVAGEQVVYHSDEQAYAGALYLTPNAPLRAGTSFWRSRASGQRGPTPDQALNAQTYDGKLLDSTALDLVDHVGNVYNRLALWDARLVHSASCYFGTSLETGRLTQLFFFDAE